ncbi:transposon Ty3-I Gag-Pol polyprotein [Trichonephila clavipes]|nr:transposon Ty3-I Gag-Pol polyprotein [Trichonephila clavipes]
MDFCRSSFVVYPQHWIRSKCFLKTVKCFHLFRTPMKLHATFQQRLQSHDVILGWDFLEASQAVIDCGQNELVLEDICRDSTAPDAWNLYATRDYTLKPHSLTRITVSGYQTRGDKCSSRRQQTFALREKYCYTVHGIHIS